MYPDEELTRLATHKAALRRKIALRRSQCADAAARVAQPFAWLDRTLAVLRKLAPLAAVPLGFLVSRAVFPRLKILGALLRWGPLLVGAGRAIGSLVGSRFGTDRSSNRPD